MPCPPSPYALSSIPLCPVPHSPYALSPTPPMQQTAQHQGPSLDKKEQDLVAREAAVRDLEKRSKVCGHSCCCSASLCIYPRPHPAPYPRPTLHTTLDLPCTPPAHACRSPQPTPPVTPPPVTPLALQSLESRELTLHTPTRHTSRPAVSRGT